MVVRRGEEEIRGTLIRGHQATAIRLAPETSCGRHTIYLLRPKKAPGQDVTLRPRSADGCLGELRCIWTLRSLFQVRELIAQRGDAAPSEPVRNVGHKRMRHTGSGTVSQDIAGVCRGDVWRRPDTCLPSSSVIVTGCGCTAVMAASSTHVAVERLELTPRPARIGISLPEDAQARNGSLCSAQTTPGTTTVLEPVSIKARDRVCSDPAAPALATPSKALGEGINLIVVPTGKSEQLSDEFFQPCQRAGGRRTDPPANRSV